MTRAQELRKLLREVEAGEWGIQAPDMLSLRIIHILAKGTGNLAASNEILNQQRARWLGHHTKVADVREEFENGTHEG